MTKLVVVGSSNTDMIIQVPHIPAPGETILGGEFLTAAGGKGANQAVAAARVGGDVSLVACVGADMFGEQALAGFAREGIDTIHCLVDDSAPSGVAQIFVASDGENCIAVAPGANSLLKPGHITAAGDLISGATAVLMQLETPLETVLEAARLAHAGGALVILNPAPACGLPAEIFPLLDLITPNESELEILTGIGLSDEESIAEAAVVLHDRGVPNVLLTRGTRGVFLSENRDDGIRHSSYPAFPVTPVDTTGAGDVFNGCLADGLARGRPLAEAIEFAQAAAAISVQTVGAQTSAPTREAVEQFMQQARV
jgi:ribokinase